MVGRAALIGNVGDSAGDFSQTILRVVEEEIVVHARFGAALSGGNAACGGKEDTHRPEGGVHVVGLEVVSENPNVLGEDVGAADVDGCQRNGAEIYKIGQNK